MANNPTDSELLSDLAQEANSEIEFLLVIFRHRTRVYGRGVQSRFLEKAGFRSRSFLSEFLAGKKKLSKESLRAMKAALGLPKEAQKLFELLAIRANHQLSPKLKLDVSGLENEITLLRKRLVELASNKKLNAPVNRPHLFQVYAALGSNENGASLDQISSRTKLSEKLVLLGLAHLVELRLVEKSEDRYFALSSTVDSLAGNSAHDLAAMIGWVCREIQARRVAISQDPQALAVYSAFSIKPHRRLELKSRLREAIFQVLDEFQEDEGSAVEQIFITTFGS